MARRLLLLLALLTFLMAPALALAETVSFELVIREELSAPAGLKEKATEEMAKIAVERLQKRLHTARVKDVRVERAGPATIRVTVEGGQERGWMEALLTAPGRMTLRAPVDEPTDWLALASELPKGIEIRGAEDAYLWSASRRRLEAALKKLAVAGRELVVLPDAGGWRALELGAPLASEKDLRGVRSRRSSTGNAFVSIDMRGVDRGALAAMKAKGVQQMAVVLDGEFAGYAPLTSLDDGALELTAPETIRSREARAAWADQVAGRLAAPLPIQMAALTE